MITVVQNTEYNTERMSVKKYNNNAFLIKNKDTKQEINCNYNELKDLQELAKFVLGF